MCLKLTIQGAVWTSLLNHNAAKEFEQCERTPLVLAETRSGTFYLHPPFPRKGSCWIWKRGKDKQQKVQQQERESATADTGGQRSNCGTQDVSKLVSEQRERDLEEKAEEETCPLIMWHCYQEVERQEQPKLRQILPLVHLNASVVCCFFAVLWKRQHFLTATSSSPSSITFLTKQTVQTAWTTFYRT